MKKIIFFLLFSSSMSVSASELWECRDIYQTQWDDILLTATIDEKRKAGIINVAGVFYDSVFTITGFDRRWDFGNFKYSFIVSPNGDAKYYDFTSAKKGEAISPSMFFKCRRSN
jgi:hypothetical protein